jgi:predicted enzyme related to lactoylglutathione lyase
MQTRASQPVVHLELHTGDLPGARDFYAALCGWSAERIHASQGSYLALELSRGEVGGGIVECPTARPLWLPYVEVPQVDAATDRARELGAAVLLEPREGPAGWRSVVAAPAAGELAFWQPKRGG